MIEVLLVWIVRVLVLLMVMRLVFRGFGGRRTVPRGQPPRSVERSGGTLVRDPNCGTYLPVSRAVRVGTGADAQYFCSDACRDAYRARESSVA